MPFRSVAAISFNSFSDMESSMLREAPFRSLFFVSPRLADRAAPAAFCWALDVAGIAHLAGSDRQAAGQPGLILCAENRAARARFPRRLAFRASFP
ncbi:hypothetical protein APX01_12790 [Cereibacter sphaeroides]|nr:hypothetical protein APX01_12790 [Cereibacter sphaeroides]ANS35091.1 hypothetical protein A3858_12825 [Cereibacter sphaeroides]ATN64144.1 hypothetical protein A3857_12820 [Cereibacter sphaeroides]